MTDIYTCPVLETSWYAQDDMIIRWIRQTGRRFEPVTTPWMLEQLAKRGGVYVDVGASTGWFAVPIAKHGRQVIAFECNGRAIKRLKENCELNGVTITLHEAAASNKAGTATFGFNPRLPLTSGGSLERVAANRAFEEVPTMRLDDVIEHEVALLKIDVEGHEIAVLEGAERLIGESRPPMVLEANTGHHEELLAHWLDEHGYDYRIADERNLLCLPRS